MTINELCNLFSAEISKTFDLSKDEIANQLFCNTTLDMREEEIYSQMIINSILLSANLSAQVVIAGLVRMGVIPPNILAEVKLKPDIHLVKSSKEVETSVDNQEEVKINFKQNASPFKTKDKPK